MRVQRGFEETWRPLALEGSAEVPAHQLLLACAARAELSEYRLYVDSQVAFDLAWTRRGDFPLLRRLDGTAHHRVLTPATLQRTFRLKLLDLVENWRERRDDLAEGVPETAHLARTASHHEELVRRRALERFPGIEKILADSRTPCSALRSGPLVVVCAHGETHPGGEPILAFA